MQFKEAQANQLQASWNEGSWFYTNLGPPARMIIECAFGINGLNIPNVTPRQRSKCQEDVTLALSVFARKIGCDKAHAVQALLTGSISSLIYALERIHGHSVDSLDTVREAWETAFRDINVG